MLSDVAKKIQQRFGPEHTYRVGGDEFVAFEADGDPEKVHSDIDRIIQNLNKEGYNISFGISVKGKEQDTLNIQELVKEAEGKMFSAKRSFYHHSENDRSNRSIPRN